MRIIVINFFNFFMIDVDILCHQKMSSILSASVKNFRYLFNFTHNSYVRVMQFSIFILMNGWCQILVLATVVFS